MHLIIAHFSKKHFWICFSSSLYRVQPCDLHQEKKKIPISSENLFVSSFLIKNWSNKKKDNAQWLKSIFTFHCAGTIYHCVHFGSSHYPLNMTSDQLFFNIIRFCFLFNFNYYHDKKSKTIFNENYQLVISVK